MTAETQTADLQEPTMIALRPTLDLRKLFQLDGILGAISINLPTLRPRTTEPRAGIRSPRLDAPTLGIPGGNSHILTYR